MKNKCSIKPHHLFHKCDSSLLNSVSTIRFNPATKEVIDALGNVIGKGEMVNNGDDSFANTAKYVKLYIHGEFRDVDISNITAKQ